MARGYYNDGLIAIQFYSYVGTFYYLFYSIHQEYVNISPMLIVNKYGINGSQCTVLILCLIGVIKLDQPVNMAINNLIHGDTGLR